mgnify:CR=1 FL=1
MIFLQYSPKKIIQLSELISLKGTFLYKFRVQDCIQLKQKLSFYHIHINGLNDAFGAFDDVFGDDL